MVVGGGFGEVWPFGPGASAPMGARGGVCDQWLVVGLGRFGPSAPVPLPRWGRGVDFVVGGVSGEIWPFGPGPSRPAGARGGSL